jgi:hypothetical protein
MRRPNVARMGRRKQAPRTSPASASAAAATRSGCTAAAWNPVTGKPVMLAASAATEDAAIELRDKYRHQVKEHAGRPPLSPSATRSTNGGAATRSRRQLPARDPPVRQPAFGHVPLTRVAQHGSPSSSSTPNCPGPTAAAAAHHSSNTAHHGRTKATTATGRTNASRCPSPLCANVTPYSASSAPPSAGLGHCRPDCRRQNRQRRLGSRRRVGQLRLAHLHHQRPPQRIVRPRGHVHAVDLPQVGRTSRVDNPRAYSAMIRSLARPAGSDPPHDLRLEAAVATITAVG